MDDTHEIYRSLQIDPAELRAVLEDRVFFDRLVEEASSDLTGEERRQLEALREQVRARLREAGFDGTGELGCAEATRRLAGGRSPRLAPPGPQAGTLLTLRGAR